jgi:carbon-monoxide dehydrogenase medium subunit
VGIAAVKPTPLEYARPASLEEALELLADHGDEAKVLAGGQSLVPLLNMRLARPALLVDINRVGDLDNVARDGGGETRVGALVRQASAGGISRLVDACLPHIGHFVTRNRGTVGGSIAHADAKAELPLVLLVHGGSVVAAARAGRREIAAEEFFVTHFTTALETGELLVETVWPTLAGLGVGFEEFALRSGDYALAMAAVALRIEDGRAAGTRVGVGATVDRPTLLAEVAALVDGHALDTELARQAGATAAAAVDPADGLHASAAYQRHLTGLLVERALIRAWADAQAGQAA